MYIEKQEIKDSFSDEKILAATLDLVPWYTDLANFVVSDIILENLSFHQKNKFLDNVNRVF